MGDVVAVAAGQRCRQRGAVAVSQHVVFREKVVRPTADDPGKGEYPLPSTLKV